MNKIFFQISVFLMSGAVVLGAFGAHALKNSIDAYHMQIWQTAVMYHFIHALGAILLFVLGQQDLYNVKRLRIAIGCLLIGILFFSGSLYLLAIKPLLTMSLSWVGPITPVGGVFFILGWIMAALSVYPKAK